MESGTFFLFQAGKETVERKVSIVYKFILHSVDPLALLFVFKSKDGKYYSLHKYVARYFFRSWYVIMELKLDI